DQFAFDTLRVIDTVVMGNERLWSALEERERCEEDGYNGRERPSGKLAIKFTDISKAYPGNEVIDGFSGIINRGEKIVLIGRNGSGKTTMLKALLSEPPDSPNDQVGG
ncbi:MAG: ATP-binding cassette domain-containing protein, partial [Acidobacteriota bacterium]|nr:ATP-binding cassette domain-containing protein [Acidobacteriota bacterium]